jgi:hypothetical protein
LNRLLFGLRILALVLIAVVITLATGEVHTTDWGYGLPLPWKFDSLTDCASPFLGGLCPLIRSGILVDVRLENWYLFALDVVFYATFGYAILLTYSKYRAMKTSGLGSTYSAALGTVSLAPSDASASTVSEDSPSSAFS